MGMQPAVVTAESCITKQSLMEMPENAVDLDENEQINIFSKLLVKNLIVQECTAAEQEDKEEEIEIKSQAMAVLKQLIQEECKKMDDAEAEQTNAASVAEEAAEAEAHAPNDVPVKMDEKIEEEVKP